MTAAAPPLPPVLRGLPGVPPAPGGPGVHPAPAGHAVHDLIRNRWSPLAFSERPVEPEKIASLIEAARWAPSSINDQPWHLIAATRERPEEHEKLLGVLAEFNRVWARRAPLLVLTVARLAYGGPLAGAYGIEGKPNRHALHDVGLATGNLLLQATALGLSAHVMGGFARGKAQALYGIPDGYEPVSVIAIGYPGDPEALPPELRKREEAPRSRKPLDAFVFGGQWGQASPLVNGGDEPWRESS